VVIRAVKPSDISALAELHVAAWQVAYRRILPDDLLDNLSVDQAQTRWGHLIKDNQRTTLVAEANGQPVGFVGFGASRDQDDNSDLVGEIYAVYVHPAHWGQGVGTALLRRAMAQLRDQGFQELTVWTLTENSQARTFYEKNGFLADGAIKNVERRGVCFNEVRYRQRI
jgi:GNAT superfamily N-acetyltransferase